MPITEAEAVAALPPTGWVRRYVIHALRQTTSPLVYHLGVGLATMGVTCPLDYGVTYAGVLRANNFCLLVGRSGEDQKSSALGIGAQILRAAAPQLIGMFPGSPEGLYDSLAATPSQLIPISEFGKFLSSASRGYFEPTKTALTDLWDAHDTQRAKANGKTVHVVNPRLSVTAACSIPYLEKHTLAEDWTGGFMGRWLVLYGYRERTDAFPGGDMTDFGWLVSELSKRAQTPQAGKCKGIHHNARAYWNTWFTDVSNRSLPGNIIGIRSRAPTMAIKAALVYSWDFGQAQFQQDWYLDLDVLVPAIALIELHIKSLVHLSEAIADHPDARMRRSVLQAIDSKGGSATLGEILGVMKMRQKPVAESLSALVEEGRLQTFPTATGAVTYVNVGIRTI